MEELDRNVTIIKGGSIVIELIDGSTPCDFKLTIKDFVLLSEDGLPINEYDFNLGIARIIQLIAARNRTELEDKLMPLNGSVQDEPRPPS